jgi:hypothetical protein
MKIYLDIDGTLIHEDLTENYGKPAAGLEDFITALKTYDVYWLTTHCRDNDPSNAQRIVKAVLPESFHEQIDSFKPVIWDVNKTEALDWDRDFIWFDNDIFDEEWKDLEKCNDGQSVIQVDLRANPEQLIEITREIL